MHMHALACNSDYILIFSIALIALTYYTTHGEQARDRVGERESENRTKRTCARRQLIETETATPATTIALSLESEQSFVRVPLRFAARSRTSSNMFAVQPGSVVTSSHCRPSFIICCRCFSAVAVVVGNFMLPVLFVAVVRRCCSSCCCCC